MNNKNWEYYHYTPLRVHLGVSIPLAMLMGMNLFFAIDLTRGIILFVVIVFLLIIVNFFLKKIDTSEPCLKIIDNEIYFRIKKKWHSVDEAGSNIEFVDSQSALRIKYLKEEFIANIKPSDYLSVKEKIEVELRRKNSEVKVKE